MSSTDPNGPPDGFVTSADACAQLGISDRTLRRRVAAGRIEGEYLPRPQGTVLYVRLPNTEAAPRGDAVSDSESPPGGQETAQAALTPTLEAYMALVVDIRTLERENGALESSVDAYRREVEWLKAELERARRPWWRRWLAGF